MNPIDVFTAYALGFYQTFQSFQNAVMSDVIPHVHVNAQQADQMTKNGLINPKFALGVGIKATNVYEIKAICNRF